jgi:hypothetical protein
MEAVANDGNFIYILVSACSELDRSAYFAGISAIITLPGGGVVNLLMPLFTGSTLPPEPIEVTQ